MVFYETERLQRYKYDGGFAFRILCAAHLGHPSLPKSLLPRRAIFDNYGSNRIIYPS